MVDAVAEGGFRNFMQRIGGRPVPTAAEEQALSRRASAGDARARDELIERNVGLVVSIARRYSGMSKFDINDLVQEGFVGLIRAVDKFDPEKGYKLSTYATWWIKQAIFRYMNGSGGAMIRIPSQVKTVRRKVAKHVAQHGCSEEDAALALGIEPEDFTAAFSGPRVAASLDEGYDDEDGNRYERIADPHAEDPAEDLRAEPRLNQALAQLGPFQRRIVELRIGFDGEPLSQDETADSLGISRKRVGKEYQHAILELRRYLVIEDAAEQGTDPVLAVLGSYEASKEVSCEAAVVE